MELIIFIFILAIVAAYLISFRNKKISRILENKVVAINNKKIKQDNLLLKKYAIPLQANNSSQIEVVIPLLNEIGELVYTYSLHFPSEIYLPNIEEYKQSIELRVARKLSIYIREHLKTEKEIEELSAQYYKVHDLKELILKSEVYQNQIDIYDRAIDEICGLIDKAKQLEKMYLNLIREELIGVKIQNYNPTDIKDNQISHHLQYEQLKDEYEYMKEEAKAYSELMYRTH